MAASDCALLFERFPKRASAWKLRTQTLQLPARPLLMGILNVTPDSFSDGGQFREPKQAVARALQIAAEGADMLDIGGQSTRPYAELVSAADELRRVMPVLEAVIDQLRIPVSIDTFYAEVARKAVRAGAEIINDVTALQGDSNMLAVAVETGSAVCAMHMQGTPQTMQDDPTYTDVRNEVFEFLKARRDTLASAGIDRAKIALDPGIGFGKTHDHNLTLVRECWRLHELGCPVLVGHSRKGFIGKVIGNKEANRTAGNIGVACALASQGVQILRVHDIAAVRQGLMLYEAATNNLPISP